eukprot:TRINITY_DN26333_c0_g1_i1.p1 TRINITY_DN26333_c0_g1~~TRINITY_DN26333_c0_g1_i1.p1  ORF type:complete len:879 (-),score=105.36 TRINITY_DN26333_c0_g1_i1:227-2863(-)
MNEQHSSDCIIEESVAPKAAEWESQLNVFAKYAPISDVVLLLQQLSHTLHSRGMQLHVDVDGVPALSGGASPYVYAHAHEDTVDLASAHKAPRAPDATLAASELDKVQFSARIYYFEETEREAKLTVQRLGKRDSPGSVCVETAPGSAQPGHKYVHTTQKLDFAPGEDEKEVSIKLLGDDCWHATEEFSVRMLNPENVQMSPSLKQVRVKIIDKDTFPTARYADVLMQVGKPGELRINLGEDDGQVSHWKVMFEYFRMNFRNRVVRTGSLKCLLADQIKNCLFVAEVILNMILVDQVLGKYMDMNGVTSNRTALLPELLAIAGALLSFTLLEHFLDYRRCFWKVGGTSRKFLQSNLLRRNLAYTPESRALVPTSALLQACTTASHEVVHKGYLQVFPVLRSIGSLLFLALFQGIQLGVLGLAPIFIFPIAVGIFMSIRDQVTSKTIKRVANEEIEIIDRVTRTCDNMGLLQDYGKRGEGVSKFEETIARFNKAYTQAAAVAVNNKAFLVWIGDVLVAFFIVAGGYHIVLQDTFLSALTNAPTLGAFLAILKIMKTLASAFTSIYSSILLMLESFPSIEQVVTLLNLPIEDHQLLTFSKDLSAASNAAWRQAQKREYSTELKAFLDKKLITRSIDAIPFTFNRVEFRFPATNFQLRLDCEIRQGEMVGIISYKHASGKATVLRLMAGVLIPESGFICIPPHLKVLQVTTNPLFFNKKNLLANLCLSLPREEHAGAVGRVHAILKSLGIEDEIINQVSIDGGPGVWQECLSKQQAQLLSIARALIASPEVLIAHTPLLHFTSTTRLLVQRVLREFVDMRGFMEEDKEFFLRHPRTCVMSFHHIGSSKEMEVLDRLFELKDGSLSPFEPVEQKPRRRLLPI